MAYDTGYFCKRDCVPDTGIAGTADTRQFHFNANPPGAGCGSARVSIVNVFGFRITMLFIFAPALLHSVPSSVRPPANRLDRTDISPPVFHRTQCQSSLVARMYIAALERPAVMRENLRSICSE